MSYHAYKFLLTVCQKNAPNGLVMRSRPYRNKRIISAIRDLYFTGGSNTFARRFVYLFPTCEGGKGEISREVPIPMVALVATAVSHSFFWPFVLLTQITSCMRHCMSGVPENSKWQSSLPMPIWMYTSATSTPSSTFGTTALALSI